MERAITRARTRRNYVFIICRESRLHWLRGYKPKKMDRKIDNIVRHAEVSEKAIEAYLVKRVKELGGVCLKYSNPNLVGYPDRVVLLPNGVTVWIELKSKGRDTTKIQKARIAQLESLGHTVAVVDSREGVDAVLKAASFMVNIEGVQ